MPTKSQTHDISINNLQSAICQLRDLYEDLELIVDQHDKSLDWLKAEISDKELISGKFQHCTRNGGTKNGVHTSATQQDQDTSSDSRSESESEEMYESESNSISSNTKRNDSTPNHERRYFGL